MEKKITRSTFKSFLKKNEGKIFVKKDSDFDGMTDCVQHNNDAKFAPAYFTDRNFDNTLGVVGVWLVGSSRDYFKHYEDDKFVGIKYYNCCGSGIVAVMK